MKKPTNTVIGVCVSVAAVVALGVGCVMPQQQQTTGKPGVEEQKVTERLDRIEKALDRLAAKRAAARLAASTPKPASPIDNQQRAILNRLQQTEASMQQLALLKRLERIEAAVRQPAGVRTAGVAPTPVTPVTPPATATKPTAPTAPTPEVAKKPEEPEAPHTFAKIEDPAAKTQEVPTAVQPVAALLKGLGVKEDLINSRSEWCECLEEDHISDIWESARGFVHVEGEKFPALTALPPPPIPPDNKQKLDPKTQFPVMDDPKVQLGKLLFFDGRLSGDNSVSCATCHAPDQGWGLNSAISRGYPGTSHWRNSHTIVNSAYMWKLFWDGSAKALEPQGKSANTGLSGNGKTDMMEERLRQCPDYVQMFKDVFGTEIPLLEDAWRAIAAFERVMVQPDTPFDLYMKGDKSALSESQIRGKQIFEGKAKCIQCHNGPMFSDQKYYNLGLPQEASFLEDPIKQITHRFQYFSKGAAEDIYRNGKIDLGLYFVSKRKGDIGKFRTQTLRYLTYTPPYMHNGTLDSLEDVVEFYNKGGGEDLTLKNFGIANKTRRLDPKKPLNLTEQEKKDLVAFLESLSGDEMLMPLPKLPDPMAYVYKGETYIGLPIPVVSTAANPDEKKEPEKMNWSLVEAPKGATIDSNTGRVTWLNAQPPAESIKANKDIPITIKLKATSVKDPNKVTEQTLLVTVYRSEPPSIETLTGGGGGE